MSNSVFTILLIDLKGKLLAIFRPYFLSSEMSQLFSSSQLIFLLLSWIYELKESCEFLKEKIISCRESLKIFFYSLSILSEDRKNLGTTITHSNLKMWSFQNILLQKFLLVVNYSSFLALMFKFFLSSPPYSLPFTIEIS